MKTAKQTATVYDETYPNSGNEDVKLAISGLIANEDGSFTLTGVKRINFNYPAIVDILMESGLMLDEAAEYVEQFGIKMESDLLAKAIATRAKVVN